MSLQASLGKPFRKAGAKKSLIIALLTFAAVGFGESVYLASMHYSGIPMSCSILEGCEQVTTSQYATVLGVPLALIGAIYYFGLFILLLVYLETEKRELFWLILAGTTGALLSSIALIYIQVAVIGALCFYCLISAASSTLLFAGSLVLLKLNKGKVAGKET